MDNAIRTRIVEMLKSGEKEFCSLAVSIFTGLTNHYEDYYEVRTAYDPVHIHIENETVRAAFNQMFNHLDKNTCHSTYKKHLAKYRRTSLSSRQKREARKREFNKRKPF